MFEEVNQTLQLCNITGDQCNPNTLCATDGSDLYIGGGNPNGTVHVGTECGQSKLQVDIVNEETNNTGVTVEDVLLKDGNMTFGRAENTEQYFFSEHTIAVNFTTVTVWSNVTSRVLVNFQRINGRVCVSWYFGKNFDSSEEYNLYANSTSAAISTQGTLPSTVYAKHHNFYNTNNFIVISAPVEETGVTDYRLIGSFLSPSSFSFLLSFQLYGIAATGITQSTPWVNGHRVLAGEWQSCYFGVPLF